MVITNESARHEANPGDTKPDLASRFMTTNELAELLRVKRNTLEKARSNKTLGYPKFVKFGGRVLYDRVEIDAWIKKRTRSNEEMH